METIDNALSKNSETVSEPKPKKTRKFTWTDKRKAQFEKMISKNREKSKDKKTSKSETPTEEKEKDESESQKITEKEEKQSTNIVKRIMDPHYLSRKDRHTLGTTSEASSESESSSESDDNSEDSSDSDSSVEVKKKIKKPKLVKIDWKVKRKLEKLRAKNKQLQDLFLNKSKKKYKYSPDNLSEEEDNEPSNYSKAPVNPPPPIYFC